MKNKEVETRQSMLKRWKKVEPITLFVNLAYAIMKPYKEIQYVKFIGY